MTFYKSRKFAYALGGFLAALILAVIPQFVELDPASEEMITEMLPVVAVLAVMLITGHTVTDVVATWRAGVPAQTLDQAAHDLIDAVADPEDNEPVDIEIDFFAANGIKPGDTLTIVKEDGTQEAVRVADSPKLRQFMARGAQEPDE